MEGVYYLIHEVRSCTKVLEDVIPAHSQRESSSPIDLEARHAQRASSLRYDRKAAGTPCPTPHRGVGGVLGKATARFAGHTCAHSHSAARRGLRACRREHCTRRRRVLAPVGQCGVTALALSSWMNHPLSRASYSSGVSMSCSTLSVSTTTYRMCSSCARMNPRRVAVSGSANSSSHHARSIKMG